MNKTRIDSIFLQLSEDEQAQVHEWLITLGYTKTLEKLAQPRSEGLNIQTHRSCLHRFYKRYQEQARAEDIAAAKENRPLSNEDASVLFSDAENSFLHAAHQLATGPINPSDTFAKIESVAPGAQRWPGVKLHIHIANRTLPWRQAKQPWPNNVTPSTSRESFELKVAEMALVNFAACQNRPESQCRRRSQNQSRRRLCSFNHNSLLPPLKPQSTSSRENFPLKPKLESRVRNAKFVANCLNSNSTNFETQRYDHKKTTPIPLRLSARTSLCAPQSEFDGESSEIRNGPVAPNEIRTPKSEIRNGIVLRPTSSKPSKIAPTVSKSGCGAAKLANHSHSLPGPSAA